MSVWGAAISANAEEALNESTKPNVLFITADDPALDPAFHDHILQQLASPKRPGGVARESRPTAAKWKPWSEVTRERKQMDKEYVQ